jgi:hypothetical protein
VPAFRERYGCWVGLSDHSATIYPGLAGAALGLDMLEVHVTLSRDMFGPDVVASLTTAELRQLVDGVRFIERMRAHPVDKDRSADVTAPLRRLFTRSIVAVTALPAGTVLTDGHLAIKKPGTGLPPSMLVSSSASGSAVTWRPINCWRSRTSKGSHPDAEAQSVRGGHRASQLLPDPHGVVGNRAAPGARASARGRGLGAARPLRQRHPGHRARRLSHQGARLHGARGENLVTSAKSTGLGLVELATVFDNLQPDAVVTIADRYETLATAVAASYMNIPVVHVQGGEVTGSIDEKVRHAVTKLSNLHLVATALAAERVVKLGEDPAAVVVTGCPSIDIAADVAARPSSTSTRSRSTAASAPRRTSRAATSW